MHFCCCSVVVLASNYERNRRTYASRYGLKVKDLCSGTYLIDL